MRRAATAILLSLTLTVAWSGRLSTDGRVASQPTPSPQIGLLIRGPISSVGTRPFRLMSLGKPKPLSAEQTWVRSPAVRCIRAHESSGTVGNGNYTLVDPPYSGAYQFLDTTWSSVTGLPGIAADYPPSVQDAAAFKLYSEEGWSPWQTRSVCGV